MNSVLVYYCIFYKNSLLIRSYNYSQKKFFYAQLQTAMQKQAVYEGTGLEKEMIENEEKKK